MNTGDRSNDTARSSSDADARSIKRSAMSTALRDFSRRMALRDLPCRICKVTPISVPTLLWSAGRQHAPHRVGAARGVSTSSAAAGIAWVLWTNPSVPDGPLGACLSDLENGVHTLLREICG